MFDGGLIGVDFSGDANKWTPGTTRPNVWIAIGKLARKSLHVKSILPVQALRGVAPPFERLGTFLLSARNTYAAIDAPFSIPHPWVANVEVLWGKVRGLPLDGRPFARGDVLVRSLAPALGPIGAKKMRETERYWQEQSINVRSTMWAGPRGGAPFAAACMTLLAKHDGPVWPFRLQRPEGCTLAEAFPAAQLRHWGLPYQRYNGDSEVGLANRKTILEWMKLERGLRIQPDDERQCILSADALDAVICTYAAAAVANRMPAVGPMKLCQTEGLIAVHP